MPADSFVNRSSIESRFKAPFMRKMILPSQYREDKEGKKQESGMVDWGESYETLNNFPLMLKSDAGQETKRKDPCSS